jgi:YVTN family beta-propeller protein
LKIAFGHSMILARFGVRKGVDVYNKNGFANVWGKWFRDLMCWAKYTTKRRSAAKGARLTRRSLHLLFEVVGFLLAFGQPSFAQSAEPATSLLNATRAIAVNAKTGKVYAVASARGAVTVFEEGKKETRSVPVGKDPVALAVNDATNRIYVANNGSGSVSVIDGASDSVIATVNVGQLPYVLAVNATTNKIFVSNTFSDVITLIDGVTNAASKIKAGSADSIVVDAKLDRAYLTGWEGTSLTVLDSKPGSVGKIRMGGMHLWGVAVDEAAGKVYATRAGSGELAVVDEATGVVSGVTVGAIPCAVAVNAANGLVYVVNHGDDSVTVIDGANRSVVATVKVGAKPQGIAVDAKSNRVYVANVHGDSVSVIDGARNAVVGTFRVKKNPFALAVNQGSGKVYVAYEGGAAAVEVK